MKKTIFNILSVLGLLLWGFCFYLGMNYYSRGALIPTVVTSLFVLLLMAGLVYLMKRFGDPDSLKGDVSHNVARNTERLAWVLYAIVSVASAVLVMHFVHVDLDLKEDVKDKSAWQYRELSTLFSRENKNGEWKETSSHPVGSYLKWADECEANLRRALEAESENVRNTKVWKLHDDLVTKNTDYKGLIKKLKELPQVNADIQHWYWFTVASSLAWMEDNGLNRVDDLQAIAGKAVQSAKNDGFASLDYPAFEARKVTPKMESTAGALMEPLVTLSMGDITLMGILLVIVLQVLILLSYIAFRPSHGHDPVKAANVHTFNPKRMNRQRETLQTPRESSSGDLSRPDDFDDDPDMPGFGSASR